MRVARITNEKKLILKGEFVETTEASEGNFKTSLSPLGNFTSPKILIENPDYINSPEFRITDDYIMTSELNEGFVFSDREGAIDFSLMPKHIDYVETRSGTKFILPPAYVNSDISLCVEANTGREGGAIAKVSLYLPINRNYYIGYKKYSYDPSSPDYLVIEEPKPAGNEEDRSITNDIKHPAVSAPIELKAGDYFHLGLSNTPLVADVVFMTLNFRENNGSGGILFTQEWRIETLAETCFLTTAMVKHFNKEDDGPELTAMRTLRSVSGHKYKSILNEYKEVSPIIIREIESSGNKEYYYNLIKSTVENIMELVNNKEYSEAESKYLELYYYLKEKFNGGR